VLRPPAHRCGCVVQSTSASAVGCPCWGAVWGSQICPIWTGLSYAPPSPEPHRHPCAPPPHHHHPAPLPPALPPASYFLVPGPEQVNKDLARTQVLVWFFFFFAAWGGPGSFFPTPTHYTRRLGALATALGQSTGIGYHHLYPSRFTEKGDRERGSLCSTLTNSPTM
jgi:hypothetical protein